MQELKLLQKPLFWVGILAALLLGVIISWPDDEKLRVVFCDVDQGDASLLIWGSKQILIDGGPANRRVLDCLSSHLPFWDRTIEMVVLSHPQADHFGGLIDVTERFNVKQFVVNPLINNSASFWQFHQLVAAENSQVYFPKAGDTIMIGPAKLSLLWPPEKLGEEKAWLAASQPREKGTYLTSVLGVTDYLGEINETSLVLRLDHDRFCALFTGDIPANIESEINGLGQCDVLKVAHHGSKYSTSQEFLEKIRAKLAVISVGKNSFGHPTPEVIERLSNLAIKILRTDQNGEVEITSDGNSWKIE